MFVKKLVEKASKKPGGGYLNGLKANDVNPRLTFHYGIPAGSMSLAYDSIQKILAISTKDGRIKLFGANNTQALLESDNATPSKFLQFLENQGVLFNVTIENQIEVWDIERKQVSYVHKFKNEITSFTVIQDCSYMYVGDSTGNVVVLKLDEETYHLVQMQYNIPLSASHGNTLEAADSTAVVHIMPQPLAESKRVLIIYRDGLIVLWGLEESKVILVTGGNVLLSSSHETKKVTSACWACPLGSKVVVGYSNGELYIWSIPPNSNPKSWVPADKELLATQNIPISKLNLGYKMDKIPIVSLKWVYGEGKASRLYVNGSSGSLNSNLFQIVLMSEQMESRTVKLTLPLPEPCVDFELTSSVSEQNEQKQSSLILLLKSGRLCTFDDSTIEKYLLQTSQSKSSLSLPTHVMAKSPFTDSSIAVAKFVTDDSNFPVGSDEEYNLLAKNMPALFSMQPKGKDGGHLNSAPFNGLKIIKHLYITGHSDGTINLWDASCPFLLPVSSIKQQSEDDPSSSTPVTALHFDGSSRILVSGDQSGMVRIFNLKPEVFSTGNNLLSLQGNAKKANSIVHNVKLIKINGVVTSISVNRGSRHLAVGSDQGQMVSYILRSRVCIQDRRFQFIFLVLEGMMPRCFILPRIVELMKRPDTPWPVSVIDMEGPTILYQKQITSELCNEIISLQFETCSLHGFEKNILLVATKDSSIVAFESESGSQLSTGMIHPKKLSKAFFMQILEVPEGLDLSKPNSVEDASSKQSFVLLCNEKAVYLYSLSHAVQGIKKVLYKKAFHGTSCCWAMTFYNHDSCVALVLLLSNGKTEIRSVPELSLLRETSIRGLTFSKSNSHSDSSLCSSVDGEIILVNGDQEVLFVSLLMRKEIFRFLDPIGHVYRKGVIAPKEVPVPAPIVHKEKKKGLFSSVMKGSKPKQESEPEVEHSRASVADELSDVFSVANFPMDTVNVDRPSMDKDEVELNIDEIDLEDAPEKPKGHNTMGQNMIAAIQKQKFGSKFQAITGKLKQKIVKNEKSPTKAEPEDDKTGSIDQIKKKYGFPSASELSAAKAAENKLQENARKLQGVNVRATEMQDTAHSFSAMAKEVLRNAEHDKRN